MEEAQEAKLELVATKLALEEGMRVLDVGCGWGSFAIQAAREHGAHVTGITLSEPQAALPRNPGLSRRRTDIRCFPARSDPTLALAQDLRNTPI